MHTAATPNGAIPDVHKTSTPADTNSKLQQPLTSLRVPASSVSNRVAYVAMFRMANE
jgi:hypothetical protein